MKLSTKNLKLPTKALTIKILDQDLEFDIYPIGGFGLIKIQNLAEELQKDQKNYEVQVELVKFTLKYGAKADDQDIQFLIQNDLVACMKIVNSILEFSTQFSTLKQEQYSKAKKKSVK